MTAKNAQTSILDLPESEFRQKVYDLISSELGLGGYARFLRLFCSGKGDYTAERQARQDSETVDEIWKQMEARGLVAPAPEPVAS